jgi:hypothetical protein
VKTEVMKHDRAARWLGTAGPLVILLVDTLAYRVSQMFFRSFFYERMVLSLLEKVQRLPPNVQAEIAIRLSNFIALARRADHASLARCAAAAAEERDKVIALEGKSTLDPRWVAPALSEAWCIARVALSDGSLTRHNAITVIANIEAFAQKSLDQRNRGTL